jgi:hypothetical protein
MMQVLDAARKAGLRVFYALHHRYRPGDYTMVKDATASYSDKEMHAALEVNIPNYPSAIVTTDEIVDSISSLSTVGISVGH